MQIIKLDAKVRNQAGKSAARRLRQEGQIPAIAYGRELPTVALAVAPKGLTEILKSELEPSMKLCGARTVQEITTDLIGPA